MNPAAKALTAISLSLVAAAAIGCGGGGDDTTAETASDPADVVQAFYDASTDGDGEAACAQLSTASQEVAAAGEESCEAAFAKADEAGSVNAPDELEIGDVEIDGDTAVVNLTADGRKTTMQMVDEDGSWKIDVTGGSSGGDATGATDATTG